MQFTISQRFFFESAHTLERRIDADDSRRFHGHTYHAEVAVSGQLDPCTGMVVDLGLLRRELARLRESLDHRLLDDVPGLGAPTLENLCAYIARELTAGEQQLAISHVRVWRAASGDACLLTLGASQTSAIAHPVEHQVGKRGADDPEWKQG